MKNSRPFFGMMLEKQVIKILEHRISELESTMWEVLGDANNEYDPIPHWAALKLREAATNG